MKFYFDFTLTDLEGTPLKDELGIELHAARSLAKLIMQSPSTIDVMEKFDWATQLFKTGQIDLDKAGQAKFRQMILDIPNIWLIMRGQLVEVLDRKTETKT